MPEAYRISVAARGDLNDIWLYSAQKWSPDRADRYDEEFHTTFEKPARNPDMGEKLPGRSDGARRLFAGRHCIVYSTANETVSVLRILHQSADWHAILEDD